MARECRRCGGDLPSVEWVFDELADVYHHAAADADKRPPQTFRDTAMVKAMRERMHRLIEIGRGECGACYDERLAETLRRYPTLIVVRR